MDAAVTCRVQSSDDGTGIEGRNDVRGIRAIHAVVSEHSSASSQASILFRDEPITQS
jgi:hypothetical protein